MISYVRKVRAGVLSPLSKKYGMVCIYDARNHGGSSWNDTLSVDALTEDLESFMSMMKMERAFLVGHSMGGLTAMKMALTNPNKVEGIFIEDAGIEPPPGVQTFVGYVTRKLQQSLTLIPEGADEFTAKTAVLNYMTKATRIKLPGDSYFKVAPLHLQNGVWKWKTNLEVIENILDNPHLFFNKMEGQYEGKALFIYGKSSPFEVWRQEEKIRKLFPKVTFVGIEGGDHLLHFFRPEFVEELIKFLT